MKKAMKEYLDEHYLGGKSKTGDFKHNLLATKLLKTGMRGKKYIIYPQVFNIKTFASITWKNLSDMDITDDYCECSEKTRTPEDIRKVAYMRIKSLKANKWLENPKKMPKTPDRVSKLKDTKLVE